MSFIAPQFSIWETLLQTLYKFSSWDNIACSILIQYDSLCVLEDSSTKIYFGRIELYPWTTNEEPFSAKRRRTTTKLLIIIWGTIKREISNDNQRRDEPIQQNYILHLVRELLPSETKEWTDRQTDSHTGWMFCRSTRTCTCMYICCCVFMKHQQENSINDSNMNTEDKQQNQCKKQLKQVQNKKQVRVERIKHSIVLYNFLQFNHLLILIHNEFKYRLFSATPSPSSVFPTVWSVFPCLSQVV